MYSQAQTVQLQGNVQLPNAAHFNGYLRIKLTGSNLKNICTTPYKPVPTMYQTYPIVNGVVTGLSTANFLSQDCLMPRVPYYVEVSDTNNIVQSMDNWYLPRSINGVVDIGQMEEERFAGPITVAVPQAIIANPSGNQTVTQPPGTSFTFIGVVNLTGTVNFTSTPSFTKIIATQVLINGITSSTYPLDVNGIINASGGYSVGGSGGISGQCLVSDGTSFKAGSCSAPFPTLYYQTVFANGVQAVSAANLAFSPNFVLGNALNTTNIDLAPKGPGAGTYAGINTITVDTYGAVTGITVSSITPSGRICNGNGCYIKNADGTIIQWGRSAAIPHSGLSTVPVTFPTPFSSSAVSAGQVAVTVGLNQRCTTGSDSGCNVFPTLLSTTGFTLSAEIDTGGGSVQSYWEAIGY